MPSRLPVAPPVRARPCAQMCGEVLCQRPAYGWPALSLARQGTGRAAWHSIADVLGGQVPQASGHKGAPCVEELAKGEVAGVLAAGGPCPWSSLLSLPSTDTCFFVCLTSQPRIHAGPPARSLSVVLDLWLPPSSPRSAGCQDLSNSLSPHTALRGTAHGLGCVLVRPLVSLLLPIPFPPCGGHLLVLPGGQRQGDRLQPGDYLQRTCSWELPAPESRPLPSFPE